MRTLSILDIHGEEVILNPEMVIRIESDVVTRTRDNIQIPVWKILVPGSFFYVWQWQYSLHDIRVALEDSNMDYVPQLSENKPEEEQQSQEPAFKFPNTIKRYDFKYKKCPNYYEDAEDWVYTNEDDENSGCCMDENACYYMDGNPLKATAMRIHPDMASLLLSTNEYDFDNTLRNLSWIEIDGHTALLFNNRAE